MTEVILALLIGAGLRSLALAAAVWLFLSVSALRSTRLHLTAWTTVLAAAFLMPIAAEVAPALLPPAPAPAAITLLLGQGITTGHQGDHAVEALPGLTAASTRDTGVVPMAVRPVSGARWSAWGTAASLAYAMVCCVLLLRLAMGCVLAARVARTATPLRQGWTRGHDIRVSETIRAPATFGSVILLPLDCLDWSPAKRMAVVAHEAAHVERQDFHVQLAANVYRAIFWFSPLGWWLRRKLAYLAEAVCDDAAISELQDRSAYADILLEMSGQKSELPECVPMARSATVRARVRRILAGTKTHASGYALQRALMLGGLLPLAAMAAFPVTADRLTAVAYDVAQRVPYQHIEIDPQLLVSIERGLPLNAEFDRHVTEALLPHKAIRLDANVLANFVSAYQASPIMMIIVTQQGGQFFARTIDEEGFPIYPYTDRDFLYPSDAAQNTLVKPADAVTTDLIPHKDDTDRTTPHVSAEAAQQMQHRWDDQWNPHIRVLIDDALLDRDVGRYAAADSHVTIAPDGDQLAAQSVGLLQPLPDAQRVPPEVASAPREVRFLGMGLSADGRCAAGIKVWPRGIGPDVCSLSVSECLSIQSSWIARDFKGDWRCNHP